MTNITTFYIHAAIVCLLLTGCSSTNQTAPADDPMEHPLPVRTYSSGNSNGLSSGYMKQFLVSHKNNFDSGKSKHVTVSGFLPTALEIPSIHLHSVIEPVALHNGQMDVPRAFDKVGILAPWTKPGENGNAVIAGHLDHYTGPAIFFNLKKVNPGDQILLSNAQGQKLRFSVSKVAVFKTEEAPIEEIFGNASYPHLNLITCAGKFNKKTQEHAMRLVVFSQFIGKVQ